jgi:2-dehydro-3-deoxyglucarate aldolase
VGQRGVGLFRAQGYGRSFDDYRVRASEETVVILQIEHKDAVDRLEETLAVPGVDGFMIGPYDLSGSLGAPGDFKSPAFEAAMAKVTHALRSAPVPGGVHVVQPDRVQLKKLIDEGYCFLAYSVDEVLLSQFSTAEAQFARSLTK